MVERQRDCSDWVISRGWQMALHQRLQLENARLQEKKEQTMIGMAEGGYTRSKRERYKKLES